MDLCRNRSIVARPTRTPLVLCINCAASVNKESLSSRETSNGSISTDVVQVALWAGSGTNSTRVRLNEDVDRATSTARRATASTPAPSGTAEADRERTIQTLGHRAAGRDGFRLGFDAACVGIGRSRGGGRVERGLKKVVHGWMRLLVRAIHPGLGRR